jgi:hypothetical protein
MLESEPDSSPIVVALEANAESVVGRSWDRRLPKELLSDVGTHRRYSYNSVKDCLRMLRNKRNHFHELPVDIRMRILGTIRCCSTFISSCSRVVVCVMLSLSVVYGGSMSH